MSTRTIYLDGPAAANDVAHGIMEGQSLVVRLPPALARLVPTGVTIDPVTVGMLLAITSLLVFAGLAAYAISKGYRVHRKGADGEEFTFDPPSP